MKKKLLIIGASIGQVPMIKKAKEMGFHVGVADYNTNAVGIEYADEFFNESTIDEEAILKVAKEFKPAGITTMQTDLPMRSIARVNEELGLCGITTETAINATDKIKMIECFKANDVSSPWYFVIKDSIDLIKDKIHFPCIFKPADNSASRGVVLVNTIGEVDQAFKYSKTFSHSGDVMVEEYMQGPEVSVEILVWNNQPHVIAVTDKLTTGAPYFVEMGHSQPSQLNVDDIALIKDLATRAAKSIGINNGPAHVEIILTNEGPKVVELGARLGGDFITSDLVPLSTGVDMIKETIKISCGIQPDLEIKHHKGSAIRFFEAKPGIIEKISGVNELKNNPKVKKIELFKKEGESSEVIKNSLGRIGCIIVQDETNEAAKKNAKILANKVSIEINEGLSNE